MIFLKNIFSKLKREGCNSSLIDIRETILDDTFCDIHLSITDRQKDNGYNVYIIRGTYQGRQVGLKLRIISKMPYGISTSGDVNTENGLVHNGLLIDSIGVETDLFLGALAELYGVHSNKSFSTFQIPATLFSLNPIESDLDTPGYYKFKAFFNENEEEELYSEMYININLLEGIIELHEKDQEYRSAIIKTFSS